ncbi:HYR domain-containing protein [Myxococcus sp. K15C18031901]|uniref:ELWxxDGT repeat protein n=1 Tax=Myxococcus dinghuensis TaxID=2906761 RepID=UPI0020A82C19|nr:ELWxxDGT repeat protein [Myxococcus dinghuensis]MCP3098778.1 HYR domain-containing protein [Myxococcus dinghuensis]
MLLTLDAGCGPELVPPEQAPGTTREALGEGPAFLVKDINTLATTNLGSAPKHFVAIDGALYFAASNNTAGEELWKTDGTSAGTVMVADLCAGPCSAKPRSLTAMEGALYFFAADSSGTLGLWRSDGTLAGTQLLLGVDGNNNYSTLKLTPIRGRLYFGLYTQASGNELWTSDGTAEGTKLLKDLRPGSGDSYPSDFFALEDTIYFRASNSEAGGELWSTDGTAEGTALVKDIYPGNTSSSPSSFIAYNGLLYFTAIEAAGLWSLFKSDGTAAGTVKVRDFLYMESLVLFNGRIYFSANDPTAGLQLWQSDGTTAGTVLAVDLRPGIPVPNVSSVRKVGDHLFFTAYDATAARAMWRSDGTLAGTQRLLTAPRYMDNFNVVGGSLYFTAEESSFSAELWVSDLTTTGTHIVKDINPGTSAGAFSTNATNYFGTLDGVLYFGASDGSTGNELWRSDGTAAGTTQVRDIFAPFSESAPSNLILSNGLVFFTANDGSYGTELWRTNGTTTGTYRYWDLCRGACSPILSPFAVHGLNIFYTNASDGIGGSGPARLMRSPTSSGTSGALPVDTSLTVTSPRLVSFKSWLYFRARDTAYGDVLRMTNGSSTTRASETTGRSLFAPDQWVVSNGMLFFTADDGSGSFGTELYKTDGGYQDVTQVKDIWPGPSTSFPLHLTDVNGTLFFRATDGTGPSNQLWKSDGTSAGTVKVATFFPDRFGELNNFKNVSGTLFFFASDQTTTSLWKSDGTSAGTVKVKDLPVRYHAQSTYFATVGNTLYFGMRDDAHGHELWKSDGTPEGTGIVMDILPGRNGGLAAQSYNDGALVSTLLPLPEGLLLFSASDGENGMELWMTDGTAERTVRLTDLAPGGASSTPTSLTRAGDLIYFAATDAVRGRELWALRVADLLDRTPPSVSCPADVVVEAPSPAGASVTYPAAVATDDNSAPPSLTYSRPSGSDFPLGTTAVTVTARDLVGNRATCAFTVTVRDTTAPVLQCAPDVTAWTTSEDGARVHYAPSSARDAISHTTLSYDLPSGGVFPLGRTTVNVTATDATGNTTSCDFQVDVIQDLEPPVLTCPSKLSLQASSCEGAVLSGLQVRATDALSPVTLSYSDPLGAFLPVGNRALTVKAVDAAGNSTGCRVLVRVLPPEDIQWQVRTGSEEEGLATARGAGTSVSGSRGPSVRAPTPCQ